MKKSFLLLLTTLLITYATPATAYAKVMSNNEGQATVAANEIISDDLWVSGKEVVIEGVVEGDLYAAGESIKISGTVNGDIFAVGSKIIINGKIGQDLYAAGESISLAKALIADTTMLAGANVVLDNATRVGGSLLLAGATVNNEATVARTLMMAASSLVQNASVLGEARLAGRTIMLGDKSNIIKDLNYVYDDKEGSFTNQGKVGGSIHQSLIPQEYRGNNQRMKDGFAQASKGALVISYVAAILTGLFFLWVMRKKLELMASKLESMPLKSLWVGFLIAILTPIILIIPLFSGVATPLALILFALYFICLYLGKIVTAIVLGRAITHTFGWGKVIVVGQFVIGITVLYAMRLIPAGGSLAMLVATFTGLGAIYLAVPRK